MSTKKKLNILFIQNSESTMNVETEKFNELFAKVDMVLGEQKALKLIYNNEYDIIVSDITVKVDDGITFMKQVKQMKPNQRIITLIAPIDEEKLGGLIEGGIDAFVLTPEQFEQALEAIAQV